MIEAKVSPNSGAEVSPREPKAAVKKRFSKLTALWIVTNLLIRRNICSQLKQSVAHFVTNYWRKWG
ncbi:hypothetical protein CN11_08525 [Haemophilus influenzae]|nr:hypothetical protein CN10_00060 [Haemophilus influenzae]KAI99382.1 hypothetical protein CK45_08510 [Haemophilus influenzae]KAJ01327.1 hypothetical protein CN11_08525 [Haemophilus influenzae]